MTDAATNYRLLFAIQHLGETRVTFCRKHGVNATTVRQLIVLKITPVRKDGEYRKTCLELSELLGIPCCELFPPDLYGHCAPEVVEVSMESIDLMVSLDPSVETPGEETIVRSVLGAELQQVVHTFLSALTALEERIIRMRFGIGYPTDSTLEEVGLEFGLTRERVRQIEAKALRKLRQQGVNRRGLPVEVSESDQVFQQCFQALRDMM